MESIVIVAKYRGIGIDVKLNGYDLATERMVEKKVYNGRLCWGKQRVGYSSLKKKINRCNMVIGGCPF